MENKDNPSAAWPVVGQLIRLEVALRSSGLWLGPAWAVLCGIIASGRWTWDARGLLLAGLVFFLVDGVWATLWAAALETNWSALAARWNASPPPLRSRAWPHMRPGAPGDRAAQWLARLLNWWRVELSPAAGVAVSSIVVCIALGAAISAILGWQMMALSAAVLALAQMGLVINRAAGQPAPALKAALEVGLAWLAGHVAFAPLTLASAVLAGLFTLAYTGGLQLIEHDEGLGRWRWPQLLAALVLVLMRQPVAALALLFILLAQWLLEPGLKHGGNGVWFVRSSQAWLIAAMLVAAFTIR